MREPKKSEYYVLDYSEFDDIVHEVYGKVAEAYDFVSSEEASNDTARLYKVIPKKAEERISGGSWDDIDWPEAMFCSVNILDDLCFRKEIPEGNYVIAVRW